MKNMCILGTFSVVALITVFSHLFATLDGPIDFARAFQLPSAAKADTYSESKKHYVLTPGGGFAVESFGMVSGTLSRTMDRITEGN